jgi:hypothetical protein
MGMSSAFSGVASIHCKTILDGEIRRFSDEDVKKIAEHDLAFILNFSSKEIKGAIVNVPEHGVWRFWPGDIEGFTGVPACFWEIYHANSVTASFLLKMTDTPNAFVVMRKGYFGTVDYSYSRNIDSVFLGGVHWPAQVCVDILNNHAEYLGGPRIPARSDRRGLPNYLQVVLFSMKLLKNKLRRIYRGLLHHDEWNIGIVNAPIETLLQGSSPIPLWLPNLGKRTILADPFPVERNGRTYVLCEYFDYRTKGSIAVLDITDPSKPSLPKVVIELPYHVSYPYIVQHDGQIYCIPETAEAGEVYLYRALDFPYKWAREAVLIRDFAAVDNTVFYHDGRWWLLCSAKGQTHNLFVWYSDDLHGPWTPHATNPVKTDIRSARPAGTPFVYQSQLYRPAQDCSLTYGRRIIINRVEQLTPTEFEEKQSRIIEPSHDSPYPEGMHTVSAHDNITMIDGKRFRFLGFYAIRSIVRYNMSGLHPQE